jgi:hypothetical protein
VDSATIVPVTVEAGSLYAVHRLSPREITVTLADLLEVDIDPNEAFGDRRQFNGFTHINETLSVDPLFMDQFVWVVEEAVEQAPSPTRWHAPSVEEGVFGAEEQRWSSGWPVLMTLPLHSTWWMWWDAAPKRFNLDVVEAGEHALSILVASEAASGQHLRLTLDDMQLDEVEVLGTPTAPQQLAYALQLNVGWHTLDLTFVEGAATEVPTPPLPTHLLAPGVPVLLTDGVVLTGPLQDAGWVDNPTYARLTSCDVPALGSEECARRVLAPLAYRAWRRPIEPEELARLTDLVELAEAQGFSHLDGIGVALEAILLSPSFMFSVTVDDDTTSASGQPLGPFEVATRLSYLLWNTGPDDILLDCAANRGLDADDPSECGLDAQLDRMVADDRFNTFLHDFIDSWLGLTRLDLTERSTDAFPAWSPELMVDLHTETLMHVTRWARDTSVPFRHVIDAPTSWLNRRLAQHYGVDGHEPAHPAQGPRDSHRAPLSSIPDGPCRRARAPEVLRLLRAQRDHPWSLDTPGRGQRLHTFRGLAAVG